MLDIRISRLNWINPFILLLLLCLGEFVASTRFEGGVGGKGSDFQEDLVLKPLANGQLQLLFNYRISSENGEFQIPKIQR